MTRRETVVQTLAYSAYFSFPLTPEEVVFWLISPQKVTLRSLQKYLIPLNKSEQKLRHSLLQTTRRKQTLALDFVRFARHIPGIDLIALTGSVAAGNSRKDDDIDLLIVTEPYLLWIIRPLILLFLSQKFHRRHPGDSANITADSFCPNLWLDAHTLAVPSSKRSLYSAHEVLQIKPLYDRGDYYLRFLRANRWTSRFLANAYSALVPVSSPSSTKPTITWILAPLNYLLFLVQYLYMLPKKTTELVSPHLAYFHKNNLSHQLTRHLSRSCL